MVIECIELAGTSGDRDYINLRGEVLPFVQAARAVRSAW
jgi:hypothetical protein